MMRLAFVAFALLLCAQPGAARPTYFEVLTGSYGFVPGDPLYACGVCHYKWDGTGARNPFGTSVEQQLYLGKSIEQALEAAVAGDADADSDGFTSLAELEAGTLPGYSCDNYFEAIGAPANWHTFVTPGVASCLEPKDVRVAPSSTGFLSEVGDVDDVTITVFNNGAELPIEIESYGFVPPAPAALSVEGPPAPFSLGVGESAELVVTFSPQAVAIVMATLRISSDDPDEPVLDVPVSAFASLRPLGPLAARTACLRDVDRAMRRYGKTHLAAWTRCQADEAAGKGCRLGRRNVALLRAEEKLRDAIGGERDRRCAGASLSPSLLGHSDRCGGGCGHIELDSFGELADCLICRQGEARDALLDAALGAAPPDLPARAGSRAAERCQSRLLADSRRIATKAQKLFGRCELENVGADEPLDCAAANAAALEKLTAKLATRFTRCPDADALEGCFEETGDATCLGETAAQGAATLVDTTFALDD